MALETFGVSAIYVTVPGGGTRTLSLAGSCTISRTTNSNAVQTLARGYVGESPGASMTEITVESPVPSTDFELDPSQFMDELLPVRFTVFGPSKTLSFEGVIISDNFSQAVNGVQTLSFTARGPFARWEAL